MSIEQLTKLSNVYNEEELTQKLNLEDLLPDFATN